MARPAVRIQVVEFGVLVGLALLVGRAVQVQILHGRRWAEEAQAQRTERIVLQARRGALYDRHGTPLAVTQETYHVGIAPNELRDPTADGALISRRLGDRKSTRLNSSHSQISYAVFCLKKKKNTPIDLAHDG